MPKNREKRISPRKTYIIPLIFVYNNNKTSAYLQDISTGGAFIKTKNSSYIPTIGTDIEIRFVLPGSGIVNIDSRVLWKSSEGFGVQFLNPGLIVVKTIGEL